MYIEENGGEVIVLEMIIEFQLDCAEYHLSRLIKERFRLECFLKIIGVQLDEISRQSRFQYCREKLFVNIQYWHNIIFGDEG